MNERTPESRRFSDLIFIRFSADSLKNTGNKKFNNLGLTTSTRNQTTEEGIKSRLGQVRISIKHVVTVILAVASQRISKGQCSTLSYEVM